MGRIGLAVAAGAALAGTLARHEMWRDELQAWMIARDSGSLAEVVANTRFEGHPPLWHLLLHVLSRIDGSPALMQAANGLVALAAYVLILWRAPFSLLQRALLVLGYFPFYEYAVKSRPYALGMLLTFSACWLLGRIRRAVGPVPAGAKTNRDGRERDVLALGIVLALLAQTSVMGGILAIALAAALAVDARAGSLPVRAGAAAASLLGLSLALLFFLARPPADGGFASDPVLQFDRLRYAATLSRVTDAYLPLLSHMGHPLLADWTHVLAYPLLVAAGWLVRRSRLALATWCLATAGFLLFFYTLHFGLAWHHGHLALALYAALWLAHDARRRDHAAVDAAANAFERSSPDVRRTRGETRARSARLDRLEGLGLTLLLALPAWTGVAAHVREWQRPFSAAKETARFVSTELAESPAVLAGDLDYIASAVVGYLPPGTRMLYVAGERGGTFIVWDRARLDRVAPGWDAVEWAYGRGLERNADVLFVASYELTGAELPPTIERVASFEESIWPDERYHVYRLRTGPPR